MQMALSMLREAVSHVHSFVGLRSRAKEKKTLSMFSVISRNVTSFNDLFLSCTFTVVVIVRQQLCGSEV